MFRMFDESDQTDFLDEFGVDIKYYRSKQCSCIAENGGVFDNKDDCYLGWRYDEPVITRVIRTNFKIDVENINLGLLYEGGVRFTIFKTKLDGTSEPMFQYLSKGDVIVNLNDTIRKTDHINPDIRNHLAAFNVKKVLSISQLKTIFKEDEDYDVTYGDKTEIVWAEGKKPDGMYAVDFEANINYVLFSETPRLRGADSDSVPKSITCVLRPYSNREQQRLLDLLDYTEKPEENININA